MGQAKCVTLCGQRQQPDSCQQLENMMNTESDEPTPKFAKSVKQHIELHPKIKEIYLIYRKQHNAEYRGVKLELYYLFTYSAYYEGEWKNGLPNGFGRVIYDDGSLYQGCFKKGIAQCDQALFIKNGNTYYRGQIRQNKANGQGELTTSHCTIKGKFKNDVPHGRARETYNPNSFFEGQFVNGVKNGEGYYRWNADQSYTGNFKNNKIEGKGRIQTKDYIYEGQFQDSKKEGEGEYYDKKEKFKYIGEFSNNNPFRKGKVIYEDETTFTGIFDGFQKRKGTLTLKNGKTIPINTTDESDEKAEIILVHKNSKN